MLKLDFIGNIERVALSLQLSKYISCGIASVLR